MKPIGARLSFDVRPYRSTDEPEVLDLLVASLGAGPSGARPPQFFRWKHLENPFGTSFMLVAETGDRIIGLRAFMRWRFTAGDETFYAVRAVDTATHPDYQGMGVFSRITRAALTSLRDEAYFVFNTPNKKSLPGYLKMGWEVVGKITIKVRVKRPLRFATGLRFARAGEEPRSPKPAVNAITAAQALDAESVTDLLRKAAPSDDRLTTQRDVDYLRWRYAAASLLDYRALSVHRGAQLAGIAFFRIRPRGVLWETTVADLIVAPGHHAIARELLTKVVAAAPVDHITCYLAPGSAGDRAARRSGFLPSPVGMTLVVNPLSDRANQARALESWALSLGDLEVF